MGSSSRFIVLAALAVIVVAAGIYFITGRSSTPTATAPSIAREIDSLATATTVASRQPFTGTCKEAGKAFAFNVKGEVVVYANGARALTAQSAGAQDVFTANSYTPPALISLDGGFWEASGRPAGKMALAATASDAKTQAQVKFACDIELPAAA